MVDWKKYDDKELNTTKGIIVKIDPYIYLNVETDSLSMSHRIFAGEGYAIVAIKDANGKLLFENKAVYNQTKNLETMPEIDALRKQGQFYL